MADWMPSITIEEFVVERVRNARRLPCRREHEPGRFVAIVERLWRRYETTIGSYREFSPRVESRVEHRVDREAAALIDAVGLAFEYDPVAHEYRAPAQLHVRWSWPRLPVWLAISEV